MPISLLISTAKRWNLPIFKHKYYFILREFKYFSGLVTLAVTFTILDAMFQGFSVGFILALLQSMINPNAEPVKTGIDWFDLAILGINRTPQERLYNVFILIVVTVLFRLSFSFLGRLYSLLWQSKLAYQLRLRCFDQLQSLSLGYFTESRSGDLIHTITSEINYFTLSLVSITELFTAICTIWAYIISMILLSWQLALISLILLLLQVAGVTMLIRKVREASFEKSKAGSRYTSTVLEFINGIRTVHAFAAQEFERKRHYQANSNFYQISIQARKFMAAIGPLSEGVATILFVGMLALAATILIPTGQLQLASLLTFLFVLFRLLPIVRQINNQRAQIGDLHGALEKIRQLLKTDNKPYFYNGYIRFSGLNQGIEFVNVDFGYDPSQTILHKINLKIEKGKMMALVGASGSGKTTIAALISRFYDPTRGKILIDGVDLKTLDINSFRQKIAVVSQDTFIFNASVRDNIAYALENVNDEDILQVAQLANALEFIVKLPDGLDTQLGERGVRLSGGQRQRIAIARALLRNPEILILDEATSALDSISERLIQQSIENLSMGRTVIAIAHRLSTITQADKIVVLEQGRIVEQGTYQDLLQEEGKLWNYHQLQQGVC
ncbi:ABC transporter related [Gloeothece citriformis PCC 7424]|uniref:ABC transporter related n=1 Tax=Gloeothece citriformis (strain PCC 7424) TaxID=65393 RepID=B7KAG9_GLOC7|nr:heterocyst formation ABC transporter subunit HepA [Gloeothece citriformis]ACK72943.1 ABC transporter related [Gloeothece citriformis PCC 7424]